MIGKGGKRMKAIQTVRQRVGKKNIKEENQNKIRKIKGGVIIIFDDSLSFFFLFLLWMVDGWAAFIEVNRTDRPAADR
jgi:hypothetical protein